jgi:hypothetical protein
MRFKSVMDIYNWCETGNLIELRRLLGTNIGMINQKNNEGYTP